MVKVRRAVSADSPALNELSRLAPSTGTVSLSITREPDYFQFANQVGFENAIYLAEETETGEAIGTLSVAWDELYWNGRAQQVAYLLDFKVRSDAQGKGVGNSLMRTASEEIGRRQQVSKTSVPVLMAVASENLVMRNILVPSMKRNGIFNFEPLSDFRYYLVSAGHPPSKSEQGLCVIPATEKDFSRMYEFWRSNQSSRALASVRSEMEWVHWIKDTPGVGVDNFVLVEEDARLVGMAGVWDQRVLRQLTVNQSPFYYRWMEKTLGPLLRRLGVPPLPIPGGTINLVYDIFFTVFENRLDVYSLLVDSLSKRARGLGADLFTTGLEINDPRISWVKAKAFHASDVILYCDKMSGAGSDFSLGNKIHVESGFG